MTVLLSLVLAASMAAAGSPLLFGNPGGMWLLLSPDGTVRRFTDVAGLKPTDLAVSLDEKRWAIVAYNDKEQPSLFLFENGKKLRPIELSGHKVDAPEFSPDGKWVYFTASDLSVVPHAVSMRYAQLWRIRFEKGSPEKLTVSVGCHMWPKPLSTGGILFSHATCSGGRGLEVFEPQTRRELPLIPPMGEVGESAPHSDGRRLVFSRLVPQGTELVEWKLREGTERRLGVVQVEGSRMRLAWHSDGETVLYQNRSAVWRMKADGTNERLHEITQRNGVEQ